MNNWYECSVRYEKLADTGLSKRSAESYLVDAMSVTEAEARLVEEITPFSSTGEIVISTIKRAKIAELFLNDNDEDDKYYRCKVLFIVLDEKNGAKWIAVVENEELKEIHFIAIDNCIDIWRDEVKKEMEKRCDGMLWYETSIIFVELKDRVSKKDKNAWVEDGEKQLKCTIEYFEKTEQSNNFREKRAYIANKAHYNE